MIYKVLIDEKSNIVSYNKISEFDLTSGEIRLLNKNSILYIKDIFTYYLDITHQLTDSNASDYNYFNMKNQLLILLRNDKINLLL